MCGIVGQLRPAGQAIDESIVARMCAALEHRGPDSRGAHDGGRVGLGIQRLRVIDLDTGDQPIFNEDRSVVVVLNGEIYNYRELREDLERRGHRFATQGDTETIVHLYEEYGAGLRGAPPRDVRVLAVGRAAPAAASRPRPDRQEAAALLAADGGASPGRRRWRRCSQDEEIPREVDPAALDTYLTLGYIPAPRSALKAVQKLPPAHTLLMRDGRYRSRRATGHSTTERKLDRADPRALQSGSAQRCSNATRRRLIADVPLGAFLSGGIDSSAVVAAMAQAIERAGQDVLDRL